MTRRHQVATFVALTYGISWVIWIGMALTSSSIQTPTGAVLNVLATAGPSTAAVIVAVALGGDVLRRLLSTFSPRRVSIRWAIVALLLPLAMIGVAIAASSGFFGALPPVIAAGVIGTLVLEFVRVLVLGGPLEEELGWRGFALPRLQRDRVAWDAGLLLGLIWGLWHIPLYLVPGTGQHATIGGGGLADAAFVVGAFVVWTMGLSVLFAWLLNVTRGSLIVVILFHASVNLGAFVPAAVGSTGAASVLYAVITWIVAIAVAARYGRRTLASSIDAYVG